MHHSNKKGKSSKKTITLILIILVLSILVAEYLYNRYHVKQSMSLPVKEFTKGDYPDNPASLSQRHGHYSHQTLILEKKDGSHFNLVFLPSNPDSATIVFKNIDVGLMTPSLPAWIKQDPNLTRISLTDRQWNRQQVSFEKNSPWIEVIGGDGFEKNHLYQADLAKNCLNAGLWEILLYNKENDKKTLFYQGWFTFPLGYYKEIFEHNTGLHYLNNWFYLEHWFDPENTVVNLDELRKITRFYPVILHYNFNEPAIADGEQVNKHKNIISKSDIKLFRDYYNPAVSFATFLPPGIYRKDHPWKNEYWRIKHPISAVINDIRSAGSHDQHLQEIVLIYANNGKKRSFFYISGLDLKKLPHLEPQNYAAGQLHLMGIGTAPLKESYEHLMKNPPEKSPFFSVFLDEKHKWINHHDLAIDGSILFLDNKKKNKLHIYLVSYERHAVVAHYWIELPKPIE
ncbi:MAG: hypothetical protein NXI01_03445 [Gammaproteobacteria bacterium]|nr:hypothetical protein [Gammaproteobacteria bacterium]